MIRPDRVRLLDPLLEGDDPANPARLATLRARVDRERSGTVIPAAHEPRSRPGAPARPVAVAVGPWLRRGAVLVAATAAALLIPVGISIVSPRSPVARSAAGTRLLPSALPHGVGYAQIRADESGGEGWCGPASLAAVGTTPDGVVTGVLRVTGPFRARLDETSLGDSAPAEVAGRQGRLVLQDDPDLMFFRWFFTDASGSSWIAEVQGYPLDQATALVAGLSTDTAAGTASFESVPGAPDIRVVHRRTGEPYTVSSRSEQWYVALTDGSQIRVDQRYDNHEAPVVASVLPGAQIASEAGRDVVTWPERAGGGDGLADGMVQVRADLGDGATAYVDAPSRDQALALIASLAPAAADDPRVQRYGLP